MKRRAESGEGGVRCRGAGLDNRIYMGNYVPESPLAVGQPKDHMWIRIQGDWVVGRCRAQVLHVGTRLQAVWEDDGAESEAWGFAEAVGLL